MRSDRRIRAANREPDVKRRMELLQEAEAILMEELPILPIYTYVTQNMWRPRLGGFAENFLDEHFPKFFRWMTDEELEAARAGRPAGRRVEPGGPRNGGQRRARPAGGGRGATTGANGGPNSGREGR